MAAHFVQAFEDGHRSPLHDSVRGPVAPLAANAEFAPE
jgi:hypothetical protein